MPLNADASDAPDRQYRLPRTVEPLTYRLVIEPDLGAATFRGSAEIDLQVHEATDTVVCNAADLELSAATVAIGGGPELAATWQSDEEAERVTFTVPQVLAAGPCTLRCRFSGVLNDELRGFYRSTYTDDAGRTHTMATTQMEATDARRAFPCWDEPDRKAVFELTLVIDEGLRAVSNSPAVSEAVEGGRRTIRFAPTMKMSTYLVAFVVGDLVATDPVDVDGVPVRVVHVPGKGELTGFALEAAAHALRFFSEYFALPYPADKLDLVAIPDFAFGAMENVGCVTFRETALLVDPQRAARVELERVADVVAHEIAHMWFGDLVTMRWWEGIWLNEAFATFMEVLCTDAFRPSWNRWLTFALDREMALAVDGLHTTRPIEYPVGSPAEADGMFDLLTYEKGGSVLRMLEQFLGAETFRDGIRVYLRRHAHANTVTADLWQALEEASGQPVRTVMDSWILQGGHPLITFAEGELRQSPFAYRSAPVEPGAPSAIGRRWHVPVQVRALEGGGSGDGGSGERAAAGPLPDRPVLLDDGSLRPGVPATTTLVLNAGGWGVYRSGYSGDQLLALGRRLGRLAPIEQALLFNDTWAAVLAGHTDLADFLALAAALGDEPEPTTWTVVAGALATCNRALGDPDRASLARATQALLGGRLATVGWEARAGEDERTPSLRSTLLRTLGTIGQDGATRSEALRRFDAAEQGGPRIDADIEGAVLDVVADHLRPGDYDAMLERYRSPATPQEEQRYLFALASFPDPGMAERTFELAMTEVRTQNAPYLIGRLLTERVGGPAAWERLKAEWDAALRRFPLNSHARMVEGVAALWGDPARVEDVTAFLRAHPVPVGERRVAQTVERLHVNAAFGARSRSTLAGVLGAVASGGSGAGPG